ncbi:arginine deiminase-related protein [Peptoniphilus sp. KCTC 25270]|uniref:citrulline utilization hydrolase CtlX n=1 Tax=Peptoniphilus sp. KCTC 25270 TaxID=2897414 RepID=UPI001E331EE1|nr:arginine deiminase-related protein [Peptoniphilus sp. KCTC 25270]MCD1147403.1 arginine deiminase-related protein [Peptoniphilus sp. KCTC 25270]
MYRHSASEVVMIRPAAFQFNAETAVNNVYQNNDNADLTEVQKKALDEFNTLVSKLEEKGVKVNVLQDNAEPSTPDSIFPNNWFSTHEGGLMVVYPMFAENRQMEIAKFRDQVEEIAAKSQADEKIFKVIDYSKNRERDQILEGTGSIVIDRKNRVAYSTLSPRADIELFEEWCKATGHEPVTFTSYQDGQPIYHTNIVMGIGEKNAIVGLDSIVEEDREKVRKKLEEGGNNIIELTMDQLKACAGNTLELKGKDGKNFIAMSKMAYDSLTEEQIKAIEASTEIVAVDISTIEYYGGGSVRCTIAEIF